MSNTVSAPSFVRVGDRFTVVPGGKGTLESYDNSFLDEIIDSYSKEGIAKALQYREFTRYSKGAEWMTVDEFRAKWNASDGRSVFDLVVAEDDAVIHRGFVSVSSVGDDDYRIRFEDGERGILLYKEQIVLVITR